MSVLCHKRTSIGSLYRRRRHERSVTEMVDVMLPFAPQGMSSISLGRQLLSNHGSSGP